MIRNEMSSRERMEAKLEGKEVDHIPFWPKITDTYINFQSSKWRNSTRREIHQYIGSDFLSYSNIPIQLVLPDNMSVIHNKKQGNVHSGAYVVNGHVMNFASTITEETGDSHPTTFPVETLDDIKYMTEFFDKVQFEVRKEDKIGHDKFLQEHPDELFLHSITTSPVMELLERLMKIEEMFYMLYDYPDEMNALIDSMQKADMRKLEIELQNSNQKYFLSVEDTSTTLLSPSIFETYCLKHLQEENALIKKYGKSHMLHMCGKLFGLLPLIDQIDAVAMEAFTAPTTGDTNIKDGYKYLPNKVLIGGTCASTWILPEDAIIARVQKDLEEAGRVDKLFLSSGGVIPFSATPELIQSVWRNILNYLYN